MIKKKSWIKIRTENGDIEERDYSEEFLIKYIIVHIVFTWLEC